MGGILDTDFTLIEALELTMDFVPVVSNLKAAYEFSTGKTIFGNVKLEPLERNLAAASIFLGPVAKAAVKTTKVAVTVARHSDEAADLLTASSKVHDATKATDAALNVTKGGGRKLPFTDNDRLTEINKTLDRIDTNGPFPHKRDGITFKNREGKLPEGNYKEYTVDTPGASNRGARRIVRDQDTGNTYYTDDHYENFIQIDPKKY
ncbi:ribonuclease domain-containing protein [Vibrio neptunius]|uniref:ribonuclease domain-containing protein n=1 Tax=Vibrio neptunius TaxID=170651 RepID=UPI0023E3CAB0|nr:ribonuclease domain-containing protein [Vibrio neptunius]